MTLVLLCIGAAKAGTSWLHAQLRAHPECHFRAIKELHYFDALDGNGLGNERQRHIKEQTRVQTWAGDAPNPRQAELLKDRSDWLDVLSIGHEDREAYLRYLHAGAGDAAVVGEVTPAYALLSQGRLSKMANMSPNVRILYMMRDPVERLWSHVRMISARRDEAGHLHEGRTGRILKRVIEGKEEQIALRGDYRRALRKLTATIPDCQLMIGTFEEMLANGLDKLATFLGIAPFDQDLAPVHAGLPMDMTTEQRIAAEHYLRPQYKAVEHALGRVPASWHWKG